MGVTITSSQAGDFRSAILRTEPRHRSRVAGSFNAHTNTKLSALQIVLRHRNLLAVEDTFKTTKALLTARPIFHKTDAAVRGQIFCSFLAVWLRKELFDRVPSRQYRMAAHRR
jgi:transposase